MLSGAWVGVGKGVKETGNCRVSLGPAGCTSPSPARFVVVVIFVVVTVVSVSEMTAGAAVMDGPVWAVAFATVKLSNVVTFGGPAMKKTRKGQLIYSFSTVSL